MDFITLTLCIIFIISLFLSFKPLLSQFQSTPALSPTVPRLGNLTWWKLKNLYWHKISLQEHATQVYKKATEVSSPGFAFGHDFGVRTFIVTSPSLLKKITVKDFDHFTDRFSWAVPKNDKVVSKFLPFLKGDEWRQWRNKMSPTFSTAKIKEQQPSFSKSAEKLVHYLEKVGKKGLSPVNASQAVEKYAIDVITATACNVESGVFTENYTIFEEMTKKMRVTLDLPTAVRMSTILAAPKVADFLGLSFMSRETQDFFLNVMRKSLENMSSESKTDFFKSLFGVEAKKTGEENAAKLVDDLVAYCVQLLLAGLDTMHSAIIFLLYALATNPEVQEKLREELNSVESFDYETVTKLPYLDMVISESLRMYLPAIEAERTCSGDYLLSDDEAGVEVHLKKGDRIILPYHDLHQDPRHFPNPDIFIPERFSPENKGNLSPAYTPFGIGPRACIAQRFGLVEMKSMVSHLVKHFHIRTTPNTKIPMEYSNSLTLLPKEDVELQFVPVNHLESPE